MQQLMKQQNPDSQSNIPFEFTGTGLQFFGIWIVNILLIIITLGIYFPWAKVRTHRYFHNNTLLNDTPFDYLASPNAILKGWAVALVILMAYNMISAMFPFASLLFFPLLLIAVPWILVRSLRFRMRNTAYQNIHFGFSNAYRQAAIVFVGWFLLSIISLGLLYPRFIFEANRFVVSNTGYGTTRFRFHATAGDYYKIFLRASLILLVPLALVCVLAFPQIKQGFELITTLQESAQQQEEPVADDLSVESEGETNEGETGDAGFAKIIGLIILMMVAAYMLLVVYIGARITNLTYNSTEIAGHRFLSTVRARDLGWLYATNLLAIAVSFGLLIPWTRIRMARYRAGKLQLIPNGSLDNFMQAEADKVNALGEEIGEAFDIDFAL